MQEPRWFCVPDPPEAGDCFVEGAGACCTVVGGVVAFGTVVCGTAVAGATTCGFGLGFGATGLTLVVGATADGAADVVGTAAGRGAGGAAVRSCIDEIQAVIPAISTTTTMLIPTSGASMRA